MPKLFVVSDVHGFYDEMKAALDKAGFDENNPEHWLISAGDEWDRGPKPKEVMKYLYNLPRKILIRGNHMELFETLCERGYPLYHDAHNKTDATVALLGDYKLDHEFDLCCKRALRKTQKYRDSMVNYFQTRNYIFCHSFLPLIDTPDGQILNPNWRNATQEEWNKAMWGNPYQLAAKGLLPPNKTLVFGHFHTSWPRAHYEGKPEWGEGVDFSVYYGNGYIAIDACTAYSGKVNVLVLKDDFLEEQT